MVLKTWNGITFSDVKTVDGIANASIMNINGVPNGVHQFITSWKTDNAGTSASDQITVPTVSTGSYNCLVDWGDSTTSFITTYNDPAWTHTFPSAGTYTVTISGRFRGIVFNGGGDRLKLLTVSQWGQGFRLGTTSGGYFSGCANLTVTATDTLNLKGTTDLNRLFINCTSITTVPNINTWDFSAVTNLLFAFFGCTLFNQALSLNTSSCVNFEQFLASCPNFNSALTLSTGAALSMANMFTNCTNFNQSLSSFNTANVTNFSRMFQFSTSFNNDISSFDTTKATTMLNMFLSARAFNQSVSHFNTANVTTMTNMFNDARVFNQSVSSFNTVKVNNMSGMFSGALVFNQPVSTFTTNIVTTFATMFSGATNFNQDVSSFNIAALTDATNMFASSAFSTANYDLLLNNTTGWPSQGTINNGVVFSAGTAQYNAGAPATGRAVLTSTHSWTITDGGPV